MSKNKISSKEKSHESDSSTEKAPYILTDFIPEIIPDNEEVWRKYSQMTDYKTLHDEFKMTEDHLRITYGEYLDQMRKLQEIRDIVDDRRNDLREVSLVKKIAWVLLNSNCFFLL